MKPLVPLRQALDDPNLLGNALQGSSWLTWRALLIAAMGEPIFDDELAAFRAVTGREQSPTARCDELIGIVGRRGGKSRAVAVLATYLATLCDYSDVLVPGEQGLLLCVAPDMRQAAIVHTYIEGSLLTAPVLRLLLANSSRSTLKLTNGIDIEVRAANWRRLRGVTCIAAIADESCFWHSDESSANRDTEILHAIRPALATTHGLLAIISTPYARRGATFEAFSRDYGAKGDPAILVATGASKTFNPSLSDQVIARAYERDQVAAAAAEFGGEWRTDIAAFLTREAVVACVDKGVTERPYCRDFRHYAFVDPSGGSNDSFALVISHQDADRPMLDLVTVRPRSHYEAISRSPLVRGALAVTKRLRIRFGECLLYPQTRTCG